MRTATKQAYRRRRTTRPVDYQVGDIVVGLVSTHRSISNRPKARPVVLIRPDFDGGWWVAPITTKATFANDIPRAPVPNPARCGLSRQCYVRNTKLVYLPDGKLDWRIGHVDVALVAALRDQMIDLTDDDLTALLLGARP